VGWCDGQKEDGRRTGLRSTDEEGAVSACIWTCCISRRGHIRLHMISLRFIGVVVYKKSSLVRVSPSAFATVERFGNSMMRNGLSEKEHAWGSDFFFVQTCT
jgi:hypothetical protein